MKVQQRANEQSGQAAVEAAIVLPLNIFLILGVIQLLLMMQARAVTEYAAFRAARIGSIKRMNCTAMRVAALSGVLSTIQTFRGDGTLQATEENGNVITQQAAAALEKLTASNTYGAVWRDIRGEGKTTGSDVPVVSIQYRLSGEVQPNVDFDVLRENIAQVPHLDIRLTYWFELRIPFADWIIWNAWNVTDYSSTFNPLVHVAQGAPLSGTRPGMHPSVSAAATAVRNPAYLIPVRSTWSLRMMSAPPLYTPRVGGEGVCI